MNPFPKDWELIGLFECEPDCLDENVPWCFNQLTFNTVRDEDEEVSVISPGYEELKWEWRKNGQLIAQFDLHWVSSLEVIKENEKESLVARFRDKHLMPLVLHVKPFVSLSWGTNATIP
jgi:hypothetical protein